MNSLVLQATRTQLKLEWVHNLLLEHYALVTQLKLLPGERDHNFLVQVPATGAQFVLKISHPAETPVVADFQTQALLHIAHHAPAIPVPRVIPTTSHQSSLNWQSPVGVQHVVRLFSFLTGTPLPSVRRSEKQRTRLAHELAHIDTALSTLWHPACLLELPWDLQRAESLRDFLVHIKDPAQRELVENVLEHFVTYTKPKLLGLRKQPIHNDLNLHNILVAEASHDQVTAILDFGDMVYAPLINELAVACAYQLSDAFDDLTVDPLAEVIPFVAAYHAILPLNEAELEVLFSLVQARLTMVVAISGWRAAREPDNAAYLLRNNALSWARLRACTRLTNEQATLMFRRACGFNTRDPHVNPH